MSSFTGRSQCQPSQRGFTLIEVVLVVALLGILATIGLVTYNNSVARARSTELALKFDAVRTNVSTAIKAGIVVDKCRHVAAVVNAANLASPDAAMDIAFEAVPGGFTPVLRYCATRSVHGVRGIDVARETHNNLARVTQISQGAVLGESLVSFAVPLTQRAVACTANVAPAKLCDAGAPLSTSASTAPVGSTATAATPVQAAAAAATSTCSSTPAGGGAAGGQAATSSTVDRQVMTFGKELEGFARNVQDLNTGGDMRAFTFEVAVLGGAQVASNAGHGATIFSYASRQSTNEFLVWDPSALRITFGNHDIATNININDGQNHRLTVSWDSPSGRLRLFDNGAEKWSTTYNQGGVLQGNGKLVLGQDQDSYGGGFGKNDAFQGKIVSAAMAGAALSNAQVASGPIQTILTKNTGLITHVVAGAAGTNQVIDTTGNHIFEAGGAGYQTTTERVDTKLYVSTSCT